MQYEDEKVLELFKKINIIKQNQKQLCFLLFYKMFNVIFY